MAKGSLNIRLFPLLLVLIFLIQASGDPVDELSGLDLYSQALGFGGGISNRRQPQIDLFRDATNNTIGKTCIYGASKSNLKNLDIKDLEQRLTQLINGNAIVMKEGKYFLSFPVIVKKQREMLERVVTEKALALSSRIEVMLQKIQKEVKGRPDVLFHLLWSRVMDEVWDKAWKASFANQQGPPNVIWVIYPGHPFMAGTNYNSALGNGSLAITWSQHCDFHIPLIEDARLELHQGAWKQKVSLDHAQLLQELGLFDTEMKLGVFTYHQGDRYDRLFEELISEYDSIVANIYDYNRLSQSFNIPPDELFIILLHETAYAIFENLSLSGKLRFPAILRGQGEKKESVQLVSVMLVNPPQADDEAMYLFMKSGWRGNQQTIEKFRQVLEKEPKNQNALLYLGFSLYEVKSYQEAIQVFQKLNKLTENDKKQINIHDWSYIWIGHMYDLLGKREQAIAEYKIVLSSKSSMQMSQYRIGPITAGEWAKQRIEKPFERR
jgi:tetratricopeptide (TPR) repeat protein